MVVFPLLFIIFSFQGLLVVYSNYVVQGDYTFVYVYINYSVETSSLVWTQGNIGFPYESPKSMIHSQKIDFEKYSFDIVFIMKLHINQAQETECQLNK